MADGLRVHAAQAEGATPADVLLERARADKNFPARNHLFGKFIKGGRPVHHTCGREAFGEVKGATFYPMKQIKNADGTTIDIPSKTPEETIVFSVRCDYCRRELFDGEITWR
jgi:hypothetical protein